MQPQPRSIIYLRYLLLAGTTVSFILLINLYIWKNDTLFSIPAAVLDFGATGNGSLNSATLGIASSIYVLSLPHRNDRRKNMERIRSILGLRWTYVEAVRSDNPVVKTIIDRITETRMSVASKKTVDTHGARFLIPKETFIWPNDTGLSATSNDQTDLRSNLRMSSTNSSQFDASKKLNQLINPADPLTCAVRNHTIPIYEPSFPDFKVLSPAKIACWHSHISIIEKVANISGVSVILEDDVDMEWDIRDRLDGIWPDLPKEWDIVFLGHCWSNESHFPALGHVQRGTTLHPSNVPKCTHAYALTPQGARRILLHLQYPPFSYSRALDQALSWLVKSGRLKSFSVVPSVVIQRKGGPSDITSDRKGSTWRDSLENGILSTSE